MLVSFLISFAIVHSYSVFVGKSIFIRGYQIHHFYFGMLFLACGGLVGTLNKEYALKLFAGSLMGIGIGLFADEIGLLLNCTSIHRECTYLFPDSTDIIGTITIILIVLLGLTSRTDDGNKSVGQL